MLNRDNVYSVSREGYRLLSLQSKAIGRKLRRFLSQTGIVKGLVVQMFAFEEGHTPEQLKALQDFAAVQAREQGCYIDTTVAAYEGVIADATFSLVANHYRLVGDPDTATVPELRKMVAAVVALSDCMHSFAANPNDNALRDCPDYRYRNLPCSIQPDDSLWMVSGQDVRGGGGVLEWCYDEDDAREVLASMQRFPSRFTRLSAEPFAATSKDVPQAQYA